MNSADCRHQTPLASMASSTKECVAARATYFIDLLTAAFWAAAQAVVDVSWRCDDAYISGTVTSQASCLHESTGQESLCRVVYHHPSTVQWVPCMPESVPSWQLAKLGHWAVSCRCDGVQLLLQTNPFKPLAYYLLLLLLYYYYYYYYYYTQLFFCTKSALWRANKRRKSSWTSFYYWYMWPNETDIVPFTIFSADYKICLGT